MLSTNYPRTLSLLYEMTNVLKRVNIIAVSAHLDTYFI